jgi:hypothetical protein
MNAIGKVNIVIIWEDELRSAATALREGLRLEQTLVATNKERATA